MIEEEIMIGLTNNEGLILSNLIARLTNEDQIEYHLDKAEKKLLCDIECILEKQTRIKFNTNYKNEIARIKKTILKR